MKQYLELMRHIYTTGRDKKDRTGTGTRSVFGAQMRFDLSAQQFPLLTTKQVFLRGLAEELFWFLRGSTDNNELVAKGVHIWDKWADAEGRLGPIYGAQWRDFNGVDQIEGLLTQLNQKPFSRRHVVTAWNPAELPDESILPHLNVANGNMALAPCHCLFQFIVEEMTHEERVAEWRLYKDEDFMPTVQELDEAGIPTLRLSCQLYQRKPHCAF